MSESSKPKSNRGGRRAGAGRKPGEQTEVLSVRLPKKLAQKIKRAAAHRKMPAGWYFTAMLEKQIVLVEHDWKGATVVDVEPIEA